MRMNEDDRQLIDAHNLGRLKAAIDTLREELKHLQEAESPRAWHAVRETAARICTLQRQYEEGKSPRDKVAIVERRLLATHGGAEEWRKVEEIEYGDDDDLGELVSSVIAEQDVAPGVEFRVR